MKHKFLSQSTLRIIALVSMTLDHIGVYFFNSNSTTFLILRHLGRLAFPLFLFFLIEGFYKSSNLKKYLLRLGALCLLMSGATLIYNYIDASIFSYSNIFLDLFLLLLLSYCLNKKSWLGYSSSALISAFFILSSFAIPHKYIQTEYAVYGLLMALAFFLIRPIAYKFVLKQSALPIPQSPFERSQFDEAYSNIINYSGIVIIVTLSFVLNISNFLSISTATFFFLPFPYSIQISALFSAVPLLFYNCKRGYNKKWFKLFNYIYYPLHLIIIFVIGLII